MSDGPQEGVGGESKTPTWDFIIKDHWGGSLTCSYEYLPAGRRWKTISIEIPLVPANKAGTARMAAR